MQTGLLKCSKRERQREEERAKSLAALTTQVVMIEDYAPVGRI